MVNYFSLGTKNKQEIYGKRTIHKIEVKDIKI